MSTETPFPMSLDGYGVPVCPECNTFLVYRRQRIVSDEFLVVGAEEHDRGQRQYRPVISSDHSSQDTISVMNAAIECSDLECNYSQPYTQGSDACTTERVS